jgi:RNA polymerase sigma factor (sigma-70 family)
VEASTLHAPATLARPRVSVPPPLLRFRSDEQLVALFRAGHDDAFRAIHDRYHKRLFAYARQMLAGRQDAEDALQDVFVRAYSGLRANDRDLALRAWLFRVAHNRCIDELRRPAPPPPELLHLVRSSAQDPLVEVDLRESLRRLIADVRRLPDQQRSALLLRELAGLSYAELAASLGISIGAVKSLLVRARVALAQAAEARDTACADIREELIGAYDRGVRPNANARRHMRDCAGCRGFRRQLRGVNRQLAALAPTLGPLGFLAKVLGVSGGAGGGATAGGATAGGATAGGAALLGGGGVAASSGGVVLGAGHVATLIAAAVATAGGAVEIQHTITAPQHHHAKVHIVAKRAVRFASPAPPASRPEYGREGDYLATGAAAQSASAVTRSTRAVELTPHPTVKRHLRDSQRPPTGGAATRAAATGTDSTGAGTATGVCTSAPLPAAGSATGTGSSTSNNTSADASTCSTSGSTATGSTASTTPGSTCSTSSTGSGTTTANGTGSSSCPTSLAVNTTNGGSSSTGTGSSGGGTGTGAGSTASTSGSTGSASSTATGSSSTTTPTP